MANIVKQKILLNGPSWAIVALYLKSDGASGDLVKQTILDPVVNFGMKSSDRMTLEYLAYNFAGFDASIEFESGLVDPTFKWVLSEGTNHPVDFLPFGGLIDDSGLDGTGKLQITTTGFTSLADQGALLLKVRKPSR